MHTRLARQPLRDMLRKLQEMLHSINPYVALYLQGREMAQSGLDVTIVFDPDIQASMPAEVHPGRFADGPNLTSQVSGFIVEGSDATATRFTAAMPRSGPPRKIHMHAGAFDRE